MVGCLIYTSIYTSKNKFKNFVVGCLIYDSIYTGEKKFKNFVVGYAEEEKNQKRKFASTGIIFIS